VVEGSVLVEVEAEQVPGGFDFGDADRTAG
jgi:hypothetical protein